MTTEVSVDEDTCQGTGFCVKVCPAVFTMDDARRVAVVVDQHPPAALADAVEEAERLCPTGAITLT